MTESFMAVEEIIQQIPHRYPFLLVDRVLELVPNESIVALKNVSINEHFFAGHFPRQPVMPGVLIVEALAQAAGVLAYKSKGSSQQDSIFYLGQIEKARFRKMVVPGDQLILKINVQRRRTSVWKFEGIASVDDEVVCVTEMTSAEGKI